MRKRFLALSEDHRLTELPPESLQARLSDGEGAAWVDVEDYTSEELEAWLESLRLSPGAVEACAGAGGRTQVALLNQEVFFELPALASDAGSERVSVAFLCTQNLCVTQAAAGRWARLTLMEQMAHIGSEVERAIRAYEGRREARFELALARALELFCRLFFANDVPSHLRSGLSRYFMQFAVAAHSSS
jgi:hypothetical protein